MMMMAKMKRIRFKTAETPNYTKTDFALKAFKTQKQQTKPKIKTLTYRRADKYIIKNQRAAISSFFFQIIRSKLAKNDQKFVTFSYKIKNFCTFLAASASSCAFPSESASARLSTAIAKKTLRRM